MTWLGAAVTALGIIAAAAGAFAYFRAGIGKNVLELYRQENAVLTGKVERLEHDLAAEQRKTSEQAARITTMEKEREVLRDLTTGTSAVEALAEIVATQHEKVMSRLDAILSRIKATP